MTRHSSADDYFIDANGCLTERRVVNGQTVIVHYDDLPESDITTVDGIRCTTALRTVIDLALVYDRTELEDAVRICLTRKLFTPREAFERIAQPDMRRRPGAALLGQVLRDMGDTV